MAGKALARAWNAVVPGANWVVGRGDSVKFWEDGWLLGGGALISLSVGLVFCNFAQLEIM